MKILCLATATLLCAEGLMAAAFSGQQYHTAVRTVVHRHSSLAAKDGNGDFKGDNKVMAFLRKKGKVGGAASVDFKNAVGVDEGPSGKTKSATSGAPIRKARTSYKPVTSDGVVDDLSEPFPITSSGNQWAGFTDAVMGGRSSGSITREVLDGRIANVLRGKVSLENNGGFVQMATDLAEDPSLSRIVDMSDYDGVELDVLYQGENEKESFNVHIKTDDCERQFSSYRATFTIPRGSWEKVRLPWSDFRGKGPGAEGADLDTSTLRRIGLVAIGREMEVNLALSGLKFYSVV